MQEGRAGASRMGASFAWAFAYLPPKCLLPRFLFALVFDFTPLTMLVDAYSPLRMVRPSGCPIIGLTRSA